MPKPGAVLRGIAIVLCFFCERIYDLNAKVAVLLVSPNFLASDFIHEHELAPLLKEAEQGGVKILWVPVYASAYKKTALEKVQAVLNPETPLAGNDES